MKDDQSQFEKVPKISLRKLRESQVLGIDAYEVSLEERVKRMEVEVVSLRKELSSMHEDFYAFYKFTVGFFNPEHMAEKASDQHEKTTKEMGDKSLDKEWWKAFFKCLYDQWR